MTELSMGDVASRFSTFLSELKRRHVFRIAIGYVVVAFGIGQGAQLAQQGLDLPSWTFRFVFVLMILGFPLALVLAWAFDITPGGVKRTDSPIETEEGRGWRIGGEPAARRGAPPMRPSFGASSPARVGPRPPLAREIEPAPQGSAEPAVPAASAPPDPERVERAMLAQLRDQLRTPANAIVGYSRMLIEDAAAERPGMRSDLEKILTAGELFLSRLEDLLDPEHPTWDRNAPEREALLSRMRHDLRTPLNAIIGYSELLLEEEVDAENDEAVATDIRRILTAARQVLRTIEEVVRFATTGGVDAEGRSRASALAHVVLSKIQPLQADAAALPFRQGRLLVVDDVEANRDLIAHQLARQGYTVSTAANGREALDMLGSQDVDLLLLDILMPEMDGVEVLRRIKSDDALRSLPVIVISALDEVDSVVRCIEMGAEDFVSKPFDPVLLGARIGTILEVRRLRDRERVFNDALRREQQWVDGVLARAFPVWVADRVKAGEAGAVESAAEATVLVAGFQGAASLARGEPAALLGRLGELFALFDALVDARGLETVKATGHSYVVVAGIPRPVNDHASLLADLALAMQHEATRFAQESHELLRLRVGIHTGPVVAGLIASARLSFDIWGDGVETAQQLQASAAGGSIQVSPATHAQIRDAYSFVSRGVVEVPGKGQMRTYLLQGRTEVVGPAQG